MKPPRKWQKYFSKLSLAVFLASCMPHSTPTDPPSASAVTVSGYCLSDSLRYAVYQLAAPYAYSIEIRVQSPYMRETRKGTGWQGKGGYLFTCNHILPSSSTPYTIEIRSQEKAHCEVRVLWRDSLEDVAILGIEGMEGGGLALNATEEAQIGQTVYSVGAPWGLSGTLQEGYIAAPLRLQLGHDSLAYSFLQLSLPAQPGSSGSPLLNTRGEVIGMIAEIASLSGHYEGIAFAIPASRLHKVWERYRSFAAHETKNPDPRNK